MPIFARGYRPYDGPTRNRLFRWWPISVACLRTTKRGLLIVSLIPGTIALIVKLVMAYMVGFAATGGGGFLDPTELLWKFDDAFFWELISWEVLWVVPVLLVVGSGQIAEDFRSGALQIYFSKPITQRDYVLGKLGCVVLASSLVTVVPAIVLLLGAAAFAPDWGFLETNPYLPLKLIGFAVLVSVVLGSVVLGISSLARRGWIVGLLFAGGYILTSTLGRMLPEVLDDRRWAVVHVGTCLDEAGRTLFGSGVPDLGVSSTVAWIVVGGVFVLSMALLTRKVSAVEVVS